MTNNKKFAAVALFAAALAATPIAPAQAHDHGGDWGRHEGGWGGHEGGWGHRGGGWGDHEGGWGDHEGGWGHYEGGWYHDRGDGLLFGAVAGITGAAVALATLPFHAVEEVAEPAPARVVYAPPPTYYYPQRTAYYYAPQPQQVTYYSYPAGYYSYED